MGLTILLSLSLSSQPTVLLKWLIILRKYVTLINDESIIKAVLVSTSVKRRGVNRKGCEQEGVCTGRRCTRILFCRIFHGTIALIQQLLVTIYGSFM